MILNLKRIKEERIVKGLTQDEMAQKMGWSTRTPYAKWENGFVNIGADELIRIAGDLLEALKEITYSDIIVH